MGIVYSPFTKFITPEEDLPMMWQESKKKIVILLLLILLHSTHHEHLQVQISLVDFNIIYHFHKHRRL